MVIDYIKICDYFDYLRDNLNLYVHIKDFSNFIPTNKPLYDSMKNYLTHSSNYCSYVKSDSTCYFDCLSMIPKMMNKCIKTKSSFFGTCHADVGEYVIPIFDGNILLGALTLGYFKNISTIKIDKLCKKHQTIDNKKLCDLLLNLPDPKNVDIASIVMSLEFIAKLLSTINHKSTDLSKSFQNQSNPIAPTKKHEQLFIVITRYINDHISEPIMIDDIARFCNYSPSYISRSFNKSAKMNINTYINKLRIEISKDYLLNTNKTVAEIADNVGFLDSSYYCKVFTHMLKISPSNFKKKYSKM